MDKGLAHCSSTTWNRCTSGSFYWWDICYYHVIVYIVVDHLGSFLVSMPFSEVEGVL